MNTLDILGFVTLAMHFLVIFLILLWLMLGKPKTFAEFRRRFVQDFIGIRPKTTGPPR